MFIYQILSILRKLTADFSNMLRNSLDGAPKQFMVLIINKFVYMR